MSKLRANPSSTSLHFAPFAAKNLQNDAKIAVNRLSKAPLFCAKCGTRIEEPLVEVQDTAISSKAEELPVVPCKEAKKNVKKKKHSLNAVLTLVKRATVAFVCVLLFALSFVGVLNINVGSAASGILGSVDDDLIEGDVSIYAVDCIGLAFATARHYDDDKDIAKIEKLQDELNDIQEDLGAIGGRRRERHENRFVQEIRKSIAQICGQDSRISAFDRQRKVNGAAYARKSSLPAFCFWQTYCLRLLCR